MLGSYASENSDEKNVLELEMVIKANDMDRIKQEFRGSVILTLEQASSGNVELGFVMAPLPEMSKKKQKKVEESEEAAESEAAESARLLAGGDEQKPEETREPTAPFEGLVATCNLNTSSPGSSSFTSKGVYYDGDVDTYNSGVSSLTAASTNNYLIDADNSKAECTGSTCTITYSWIRAFEVDAGTGHTIHEQYEVDYATYAFYATASGAKGQNTSPAVFYLGAVSGLSQVFFATALMIYTFAF